MRKTSQKQPEHIDIQVFDCNFLEKSNTNTPIYIKKEKEKERKNISSTEKEEEEEKEQEQEKTENAVNDRNIPSATSCRHEQQPGGRRMYNGHPILDNSPPRPDDHSLWNDRLQHK